jgi:hypothetical protein
MKEANQQPLQIFLIELRKYALNIEAAATKPYVQSVDNDDQEDSKPKGKLERIPRNNRGGGSKQKTSKIYPGGGQTPLYALLVVLRIKLNLNVIRRIRHNRNPRNRLKK